VGTTAEGPRHDDRQKESVGLYPEDMKKLELICQVKQMTKAEAIRHAIDRLHYRITV